MDKLLTVAVPAYNAEKYLEKCLPSFLCAGADKLEVIVINDGSTDGTLAAAEAFCAERPDVFSVIDKPNGGHGSGINAAIKAARGKYFRVVDADDWVLTGNLPAYLAALESSMADIVLTHFHTVDMGSGEREEYKNAGLPYGTDHPVEALLPVMDAAARWFALHSIAYRTEFYRGLGLELTEKVFYEDTEYVVLPFDRAASVRLEDIFIYEYLVGNAAQSVSVESYRRRHGHLETVLGRILGHYKDVKGRSAAADAFLKRRCAWLLGTYEKVMLIYLGDGRAGRAAVRAMRERAGETDGEILKMSARRHSLLLALGFMGISPTFLESAYARLKKTKG